MKLLFVTSEAYPLMKTGGLGDVACSLPIAMHEADVDVRLLLPGYRDLLRKLAEVHILGWLELQGMGRTHTVRILQKASIRPTRSRWVMDCPALFDRPGNPICNLAATTGRIMPNASPCSPALPLNWHGWAGNRLDTGCCPCT